MQKMRVLIAAERGRRAPIARALGLDTALPNAEMSSVVDRTSLLEELNSTRWNVLVLEPEFDGAPAEHLLAAASHLLANVRTFILTERENENTERCRRMGATVLRPEEVRALTKMVGEVAAPAREARGIPACDGLEELFRADGRRPRSGLISCILLERTGRATEEDAQTIMIASGDASVTCVWQSMQVLVVRRAAAPGAALVHASQLLESLSAEWTGGVAWADAHQLHDDTVNQAEHALRLAQARRERVCSWRMAAAQRVAQSVAARGGATIRDDFLSRLHDGLGPVQRQQLGSHSDEVAEAAHRLAQLMRLGAGEAEEVRLAGLLHDVGKCVIPDDLLAKPGALTPLERRVMDRHAREGAFLCDAMGLEIAPIVAHHHTRFDASVEVPRAARIISVADALVTMTSTRPYSAARTYSEALAELRRCRGTIFDPAAVVAAHILGASSMAAAA